jgi:hypothetical protein
MTQHEGNPLLSTEISQPVPGDETFDTDDDILAIGAMVLRKGSGASGMLRCTRISPAWFKMQRDIVRACRSMPQ